MNDDDIRRCETPDFIRFVSKFNPSDVGSNFGTDVHRERWAGMRSRCGMPLFSYLAIAAPALVGLLFFADAELGPPPPMKLSRATTAALTETKPKAPATVPILTVNESHWIAPDMASIESMEQPPVSPPAEPVKKVAKVAVHHRKPFTAPDREPAPRSAYTEYGASRGVWDSRNLYAEYGRSRDVW